MQESYQKGAWMIDLTRMCQLIYFSNSEIKSEFNSRTSLLFKGGCRCLRKQYWCCYEFRWIEQYWSCSEFYFFPFFFALFFLIYFFPFSLHFLLFWTISIFIALSLYFCTLIFCTILLPLFLHFITFLYFCRFNCFLLFFWSYGIILHSMDVLIIFWWCMIISILVHFLLCCEKSKKIFEREFERGFVLQSDVSNQLRHKGFWKWV